MSRAGVACLHAKRLPCCLFWVLFYCPFAWGRQGQQAVPDITQVSVGWWIFLFLGIGQGDLSSDLEEGSGMGCVARKEPLFLAVGIH